MSRAARVWPATRGVPGAAATGGASGSGTRPVSPPSASPGSDGEFSEASVPESLEPHATSARVQSMTGERVACRFNMKRSWESMS